MTLHDARYMFRDKNVLLFGLGLLGGGVATANWLIEQGALLKISDKKSAQELAPSLAKLSKLITLSEPSLDGIDILVLNPGVSFKHPLVLEAHQKNIPVVNEATIFYNTFPGKIIGITGTRGKTTTANWTHHLIPNSILVGNSPEHPFLSALPLNGKRESEGDTWAVTEISSFHLELFDESVRSPDIAIVTNIYRDHLNRYDSMEEYAETKKNLYRWQKPGQVLITGNEDMPLDLAEFEKQWGTHNVMNLRLAALAAHSAGLSWNEIKSRLASLPQIPFRQQIVFENENLKIINDTAATSPEGGIAAIERFGGPDTVLIAGGTDADLDFSEWSKLVEEKIKLENRIFLAGSATDKMKNQISNIKIFDTLEKCVKEAISLQSKIILFSPACKSFEKFTNEYDRGEQFNNLVKSHTID